MGEITNNEIRAVAMLDLLVKKLVEPGEPIVVDGEVVSFENTLSKDATTALRKATEILLELEIERAWQEHELREVSA